MTTQNDWTRLARYFAGECTPAEAAEIRRWLEADPERQRIADELRSAWAAAAVPSTAWDTPASWQRLAARLRARERRATIALVPPARRGFRWPLGIAAAAAVLLAAAGVVWRRELLPMSASVASNLREVRTAPTQRTAFRLADGSRVILAPGSVLRYDAERFGHASREIALEGRAYFEVVHDPRHPFRVKTTRTMTEDLGTEFAVADYPTDATVEVAVIAGSVAVRPASVAVGRTSPPAVLSHGDLAQLDETGHLTVRHGVDLASRVAWTDGRLAFADAPVADVVRELRRWYGLDLRLGDPALAQQRFTASYTTQPDSVIVRELATAIGARVERHGDIVVLVR